MRILLALFLSLVPCLFALDFRQQGPSPFDFFIEHRQYQSIQQLIDKGTDVDFPNQDGWTPLMVAIYFKDEGACMLLIEGGADIEREIRGGGLPLHYALQNDLAETVRLLVQKGVDVNRPSSAGFTPLMVSLFASSPETVEALLSETAKRQAKYEKWGYCKKLTSPSRKVKCQVPDVNGLDSHGKTAIFYLLNAALQEVEATKPEVVTETYPSVQPLSPSFLEKLNLTLSYHEQYLNITQEGKDTDTTKQQQQQPPKWQQTRVELNLDQTATPHISPLLMILSQLFEELQARTIALPSSLTPLVPYRPPSMDAFYAIYTTFHKASQPTADLPRRGEDHSDSNNNQKDDDVELTEQEKAFAQFWEEQEELLLREKYIPLLSLLLDHGLDPYFKNTDGVDGYSFCQKRLLKNVFTFLFNHPSQKQHNQREENRIREENPNSFVYSLTPEPLPSHDEL